MTVTDKFLQLVKVYAGTRIEFEHLKPITIAQWLLETGKGTSLLCNQHNNFGGMMWKPEMDDPSAWPYKISPVPYTSPSDGIHTNYVSCDSIDTWIKVYWRFIDRPVYKGWRSFAGSGERYIQYLKTCGYAADPDYVKKVIALLPEANELLSNVKDDTHSEGEMPKATWFEGYRILDTNGQVETGFVAIDGGNNVATWRGKDKTSLIAFFNAFPDANNVLIAPAGKPWPGDMKPPAPPPPPKPTPTGKRVLIDPGHSESSPGARGKNPAVQEEDLNRFQAAELKARLAELWIAADIYDPLSDDLYAIGQKANGYDAFVSLHLNAFKGQEFYTCAMVHPGKVPPTSKSAQVASKWAIAVANAIGNPIFGGTQGWPKGVMATGLSVLSGAATTNCPIFFLSEAEFIDDETSEGPLKERLKKAMAAGAKVLRDALT